MRLSEALHNYFLHPLVPDFLLVKGVDGIHLLCVLARSQLFQADLQDAA
jgi:hypothetical protein